MTTERRHTVLIVDDDLDMREILSFDFETEGFRVIQAEGGDQAFETLGRQSVDMVITDVRMPKGDGIQLLERIRAVYPEIPVIVLTGFAEMSVEETYAKGACCVLIKPFNRERLYAEVKKALRQQDLGFDAARAGQEPPSRHPH